MATESFSYNLKARPGQLLIDHLNNTARLCAGVKRYSLNFDKWGTGTEFIESIAWIIGFTHDLGKATKYFQDYISEVDRKKQALLRGRTETNHGLLSSLFTYKAILHYITVHGYSTHPMYCLLPIMSFLIVKRHHGNPLNMKDEILSLQDGDAVLSVLEKQVASIDKKEFNHIVTQCPYIEDDLASFNAAIETIVNRSILKEEKLNWRRYSQKGSLDTYFLFQFLFSALLSADKSDAIGIEPDESQPVIPDDLVDKYGLIKFKEQTHNNGINAIRNDIYKQVTASLDNIELGDKIFSLNVPTGTGKTLTGLSFALKLRKIISDREGYAPKIIYCLPFLSIIEQNHAVFEDIFKTVMECEPDTRTLLKHHHLSDITYRKNTEEELTVDESRFLIEGWESEIIVTTFMQLFHTLISNSNRMIRKFNSMVNSIIILDEIQTVPYRYWELIRLFFIRFAEIFNSRFIFMTATQPLIFSQDEVNELIPHEKKKGYFEKLDRITLINKTSNVTSLDDFNELLEEDIKNFPDDDFLIVMNTINSATSVFNHIKQYVNNETTKNIELYYLSTNIIPKHRLQRIDSIKKSKKRKIVVSTQLIEAGVDIDMDRVYRDFAPFDSLNQVAGRCNRNFNREKRGVLTIFSLKNGKEFYRYIYGIRDISISKTKDVLQQKQELTERQFLELGGEYFKKLKQDQNPEDAEYIIDQLCKLNFETACEDKQYSFKLIESRYPTCDLFIECDEEASNTWQKYHVALEEKDPFERRSRITALKKDFYNYIISVPAKAEYSLCETSPTFINKDRLELVYDLDTGFIRTDNNQYIF